MSRTVIDGNAFYEMDEECLKRMDDKKRRVQSGREVKTRYKERSGQKRKD